MAFVGLCPLSSPLSSGVDDCGVYIFQSFTDFCGLNVMQAGYKSVSSIIAEKDSVVRYLEHSDSDAHADNNRSVLLNPLDYCVRTTLKIKAAHFLFRQRTHENYPMRCQPNLASRSEVASI